MIANSAASPVRSAYSPTKKESVEECGPLPLFKDQLCSRVLWTYLILGIVLLAVVFYIFATAQHDPEQYIGVRPSGVPGFVDNNWFIYVVISIVGVLYVYGMYRAYMASGDSATKYALNFIFLGVAALIIIWFYQFYRKGKLNAAENTYNTSGGELSTETGNRICFYIAISIIVLLVLQFYLFWRTGDRLAAYTIVPLLVIISLFAWASWELSLGAPESGSF
jgi:magnesium-transporting ATPase (P-type)